MQWPLRPSWFAGTHGSRWLRTATLHALHTCTLHASMLRAHNPVQPSTGVASEKNRVAQPTPSASLGCPLLSAACCSVATARFPPLHRAVTASILPLRAWLPIAAAASLGCSSLGRRIPHFAALRPPSFHLAALCLFVSQPPASSPQSSPRSRRSRRSPPPVRLGALYTLSLMSPPLRLAALRLFASQPSGASDCIS